MPGGFRSLMERVGESTATPFRVRFPDGTEYRNTESAPVFTLSVRNERALRRAALYGHVGVLEAYFDGELDIEGSLPKALAVGMQGGADRPTWLVRLRNRWHEFMHANASRKHANRNAEFHYSLSPEFYKLWLDDPLMLYTCAYWTEGTRTLEEAQRNKCDHVARKLMLKPGEEVVDVGSGFGGFMFHAQERYGVKVTAINTTGSQAEHARREVERRRLGNALSMQMHEDFRDAGQHQFDKVASIGRVEHYDTEFFIRKYVFPGGWIPSLADVIVEMENAGLEVLDIENMRRHYALTLDVWAERFDRNWERIHAMDPKLFDERFRRIWRVYLYGCAEMFRSPAGKTHLFQIVFSKGNTTSYPMTRDFLYRDARSKAAEAPSKAAAEAPSRRFGHG